MKTHLCSAVSRANQRRTKSYCLGLVEAGLSIDTSACRPISPQSGTFKYSVDHAKQSYHRAKNNIKFKKVELHPNRSACKS